MYPTVQYQNQAKSTNSSPAKQTCPSLLLPITPPHHLLQMQRIHGNDYVQRLLQHNPPLIQAKLTLGQVGDQYEQEADRVAKQVVQHIAPPQRPPIQRMTSDEDEKLQPKSLIQHKLPSENDIAQPNLQIQGLQPDETPLVQQQQESTSPGDVSLEVEAAIQQSRGQGQPLASAIRLPMEQAFGADFRGVKVHADSNADRLNQALQAKAFTTGQDVYFRSGAYAPESRSGKELLAHELTHVLQQNMSYASKTRIDPRSSRTEEVERTALPKHLRVIQRYEHPDINADVCMKPGDWQHSDRIKWTKRWKNACLYNLIHVNRGHYRAIEERRDFYKWFYEETAARGYHTRWALAAYIVASGMAEMASVDSLEGISPITNEMQGLARIGNQVIFDDVLPKLRHLWVSGPLKGRAALMRDTEILAEEQQLIQALYKSLSSETMKRFQKIADNAYYRTRVGRYLGIGGHVKKGIYNVEGDVPAFSGKGGLVPGGNIKNPEDRWKYGMALGAKFSTLPSYGSLGSMPAVGKKYTSGKEFRRLNVRPNLHQIDARLNDTDVPEDEIVALLKKLNKLEQAELLSDNWRIERIGNALNFNEMKQAIGGLDIPLSKKLMLLGSSESYDWRDIDYGDIQSIITSATFRECRQLHTNYWKGVFIKICTDDNIQTATIDLRLPSKLADEWIAAEIN